MYIILVYDVSEKRCNKMLKLCREYIHHIQNSVFEGEVTGSNFAVIKSGIKELINEEKDSVIIYQFDSQNYTNREVIGIEKNETDSFI